eukprot:TRINITY_DN1460_c0_g1_i1.p1 TRINITY_DN1460_c0_g1~~TRINITY_DN1460_c0_g1_i1.p1  ORF type:complete len:239 (-),score=27.82 TRINITY_DN1460_c0_g1_i1:502-1218(-)
MMRRAVPSNFNTAPQPNPPRPVRRGSSFFRILVTYALLALGCYLVLYNLQSWLFPPPIIDIIEPKRPIDNAIFLVRVQDDQRYLSYISLDKQLYRPAETLMFRVPFLHAFNRTALMDKPGRIHLEILNPLEQNVHSQYYSPYEEQPYFENGTFFGSWNIPSGTPGGDYKLKISPNVKGAIIPYCERSFQIREYRVPRFKMQLEFSRKGFGPGDTVRAFLTVEKLTGETPPSLSCQIHT